MRKLAKFSLRGLCAAAAVVIVAAGCAFAVPPNQLSRQILSFPASFDGPCCMSFNQSVTVDEPAKPVSVVVTWNVQYTFGSGDISGLMVNGGPCHFYGSGSMGAEIIFRTRSYQWIVYPADGLQAGTNTFTVCGGGTALDLYVSTLMVRLSK
jgi:hypothetical protein